ncbi:MAG: alpha/beta hydrolase-fold protein [Bacteroidota bacterium]|nr:alpha/beta hydrolase-fold protein [Bacteroidota bacterium]
MFFRYIKYIFSSLLLGLFQSKSISQRIIHLPNGENIIRYYDFTSDYVQKRNIDIWLPPTYYSNPTKYFPVLYMNDGQNLFDPNTSYNHLPLQADFCAKHLIQTNEIEEFIIVGIWNTPLRSREYIPNKIVDLLDPTQKRNLEREFKGKMKSDDYLKFLVKELKPFVDKTFKTLSESPYTFITGVSKGGLISFYAAMEYPEIFGGAACLSTHWPLSLKRNSPEIAAAICQYLKEKLVLINRPKLYFDYGTINLDSWYESYQQVVDSCLIKANYPEQLWITKKFEGASHGELDWRERLHIPFKFLFQKN